MKTPKYGPMNHSHAPRYTGVRTFMKLQHLQKTEDVDIAIVGLPFDTAASYRSGARFGPSGIREISMLLRPSNAYHKINPFDHCSVIDYGDLPLIPGHIHDTYQIIKENYSFLAKNNVIPIGLGGDHSLTLGELRGLADHYGPISLVHFDAHGDTWDNYWGKKYTHGTPFKRALEENVIDPNSSIQIGLRGTVYDPGDVDEAKNMGFEVITMDELRQISAEQLKGRIAKRVGDNPVFLTFDIDFFDPAYAPGTGTPEPGGATSYEGLNYVRNLPNLNYVGFDVVEVLPALDSSEITAQLGAAIVYEFISILALHTDK
ncbi:MULTISPECIES: agmatinase [unclassified Oceanobacillus]|uniref:agmatinase n=1 Tax=unclassified Oceanobacillus TaxID=2630292 RepID=UPI0012EC274A|nr:agmatinase [Oceanobacillus sp. AG]